MNGKTMSRLVLAQRPVLMAKKRTLDISLYRKENDIIRVRQSTKTRASVCDEKQKGLPVPNKLSTHNGQYGFKNDRGNYR